MPQHLRAQADQEITEERRQRSGAGSAADDGGAKSIVRGTPHPKLLFLVTEDWYFCSHRMGLARAARDRGFAVTVATRVCADGRRIAAEGFRVIPLEWRRQSINPLREAGLLAEIIRIYRKVRPDLAHHVSIKPILYGGLAARMTGVPAVVNAVTGLGYSFSSNRGWLKALHWGVASGLRGVLNRAHSYTILQTDEDRARLESERILTSGRSVVIRGSGVDVDYFRPLPEPSHGPIRVAVVARMLRLKGIGVLIEAYRLLRQRGTEVELVLAGDPDPGNPTSFSPLEMADLARGEGISWLGHIEDVRDVWRSSHIAVLPSLAGEGISKALLEAAACGRPIVATDIPGARSIVRAGRNGVLVPPGDAAALATQLAILIGNERLRKAYGRESRRIVESELSDSIIIRETLELYDRLLGVRPLRTQR